MAEDGQASLEYLVEHDPDAVVMNMEMPCLNGSDYARKIRRDDRFDDIKLFVVSGMEQKAMKLPTDGCGI